MNKALILLLLTFACCFRTVAQGKSETIINEAGYPEMYIQYVPVAMDFGLGLAGVKSRHNFLDRLVMGGMAYVSETILVNGIKLAVNETRPDGTANNSFPSGHTATAFTGAELTRIEYGWGWGGGAYGIAAATGALRIVHNRHWWWDCVAGVGIGILSAHIANWLMPPVQTLLENWGVYSFFGTSRSPVLDNMTLSAVADPISGTYGATFAYRF